MLLFMARARSVVLIAGLGTMVAAWGAAPECRVPEAAHKDAVDALAEWVASKDFGSIERHLKGSMESFEHSLALEELGLMIKLSTGLEPRRACVEDGGIFGYYRNGLTGAIDQIRLSLDADERIQGVEVRFAVESEAPEPPPLDDAARAARLAAYVEMLAEHGAFSGVALVARDGTPVFSGAYGLANEQRGIPVTLETPFNLASLNKIFTATLVLKLVEADRLSLGDTLDQLIPGKDQGPHARAIELRHLLSHTSGAVRSLEQLEFEPGTGFEYSNLGYGVLGEVIESAAGLPYDDALRLLLLSPLGMAATGSYHFREFDGEAPLAIGYRPRVEDGRWFEEANPYLQIYPGSPVGGYYASAGDLLRFAEALRTARTLSRSSVDEMRRPKPELDAPEYGYGVMLWRGPGIWGHGGDLPGADADLEIYADTGVVAIVLANRSDVNPPVLAKIRSLFFPAPSSLPR